MYKVLEPTIIDYYLDHLVLLDEEKQLEHIDDSFSKTYTACGR